MKRIFESREFSTYHVSSLFESRSAISERYLYSSYTTVFLSHKHDDLDDLKDVIGFLQTKYNVKVYIDSRDPSMPPLTSGETAKNIKKRIKQCNKFILLATNGAIESKWCNWELGFGDAQKFKDHIAIFPIKPSGTFDYEYKGTEYMSIYPFVAFYDGTETYTNGNRVERGYYVCVSKNGIYTITPLADWFAAR